MDEANIIQHSDTQVSGRPETVSQARRFGRDMTLPANTTEIHPNQSNAAVDNLSSSIGVADQENEIEDPTSDSAIPNMSNSTTITSLQENGQDGQSTTSMLATPPTAPVPTGELQDPSLPTPHVAPVMENGTNNNETTMTSQIAPAPGIPQNTVTTPGLPTAPATLPATYGQSPSSASLTATTMSDPAAAAVPTLVPVAAPPIAAPLPPTPVPVPLPTPVVPARPSPTLFPTAVAQNTNNNKNSIDFSSNQHHDDQPVGVPKPPPQQQHQISPPSPSPVCDKYDNFAARLSCRLTHSIERNPVTWLSAIILVLLICYCRFGRRRRQPLDTTARGEYRAIAASMTDDAFGDDYSFGENDDYLSDGDEEDDEDEEVGYGNGSIQMKHLGKDGGLNLAELNG